MRKLASIPLFALLIMILVVPLAGQSVERPNYGLKSPLTAEMVRVDFNSDATVVWLTITSDINNAWFCLERETYLIGPDGVKVKVTDVKGLPWCPRTYKFKRPGETLSVALTFPATGMLTWFSLVEECMGGCLSFIGVVTDHTLNGRLNEAYALTAAGNNMAAYRIYEGLIDEGATSGMGIEGAIYSALITLDHKMGRRQTARKWYDRMMTADIHNLKLYLENLRMQGVDY